MDRPAMCNSDELESMENCRTSIVYVSKVVLRVRINGLPLFQKRLGVKLLTVVNVGILKHANRIRFHVEGFAACIKMEAKREYS